MKIAHLISSFLPDIGGAQICVHNIAASQAAQGHDVTVITHTKPLNPFVEDEFGYDRIVLQHPHVYWNFHLAKAYLSFVLGRLQKLHHFDVWQVTSGYPLGSAGIEFFKRHNIPCVLRCCGDDIQISEEFSYGVRRNPKIDRIIRSTYPWFDAFIANSRSLHQEFVGLGIPEVKIATIPNGIDFKRFDLFKASDKFRNRFGIKPKQKIILSVGRYHAKKGFDLIPHIIKKVNNEHGGSLLWIIVGRGVKTIRLLAEKVGVSKQLFLIEEIGRGQNPSVKFPSSELVEYYISADIFVLPTYIEGFPTVVLEAMAAGLPVLTSNAAGCTDIVREEENGLMVSAGDTGAFAAGLKKLLNDSGLCDVLRQNGIKYARDHDWSIIANRYVDVYEKVMRKAFTTESAENTEKDKRKAFYHEGHEGHEVYK